MSVIILEENIVSIVRVQRKSNMSDSKQNMWFAKRKEISLPSSGLKSKKPG
jgi:hypothetical protein